MGLLQQPPGQADVTAQAAQMTALTGEKTFDASLLAGMAFFVKLDQTYLSAGANAQTSTDGCRFRHAQLPWHITVTYLGDAELRLLFIAAFVLMQLVLPCKAVPHAASVLMQLELPCKTDTACHDIC